jgi:pyruvate kinase
MSHGTHEGHAKLIQTIREASTKLEREVAILCDLQGPKIRVDKLDSPLDLKNGDEWVIGASSVKDKYPQYQDRFIPTVYEKLVDDAHVGATILFDDGNLEAKAIAKENEILKIEIIEGNNIGSENE